MPRMARHATSRPWKVDPPQSDRRPSPQPPQISPLLSSMATRRHKRSDNDVGFQLAPMIDMTFLLLIFFMLTSTITSQQVQENVRVPVAPSAVMPEDASGRLILNISSEGVYFLEQLRIGEEDLGEALRTRFERNPRLVLYLRADRQVPARHIKQVVRVASEAGAARVIVATTRSE